MINPKNGRMSPALPKSFYTRNVSTFLIETYIEGDDDGDKLCFPTLFERHHNWLFCTFKEQETTIINTSLIGLYIIPQLKFLETYNNSSYQEHPEYFNIFHISDKSINDEFHFEWHIFIIDIIIYNGKIVLYISFSNLKSKNKNYNKLYQTINSFINNKK